MNYFKGKVIGKRDKTIAVAVETIKVNPLYRKRTKVTKKYQVHDEVGVKEGDLVKIIKTRPISKKKHWKVMEVIK